MGTSLRNIDKTLIGWAKEYSDELARIAIFIIFAWFGFLKVIGMSPAADLVNMLLVETLPFFPFDVFFPLFGLFEMIIGVLFLAPKWTRAAILILFLHMIMTFLPVVVLPEIAWQAPGVLTLEGQYIVKNLAIVTLAMALGITIHPMKRKRKR